MIRPKTAAFSLLEVSVSLGIAAFCIPSIMGLLSVGMNSNQIASEQTAGTSILTAVATDLRSAPPFGAATTQQFKIPIPALPITEAQGATTLYLTSEGQISATAQGARFLVTVTFLSQSSGKTATSADIKVSWPALVSPSNASGSAEAFVAINRN